MLDTLAYKRRETMGKEKRLLSVQYKHENVISLIHVE
jgi:hypothetical protein